MNMKGPVPFYFVTDNQRKKPTINYLRPDRMNIKVMVSGFYDVYSIVLSS